MARQRARKTIEHDAIVYAVLHTFSSRSRAMVVYPHESDHTWSAALPDLVLTSSATGRIVRLLAIETQRPMTRACSKRWHELARYAPLTVIVPKGAASDAERLLLSTDARVVAYEWMRDGDVVLYPAI